MTFALRTDGNPLALVDAVRQQVRDVSPRLPLYTVSSLDAKYDASIATERMLATIAGFLGGLALLLVSVGVYGTLAYAAARRTREMGVRLALGAERTDIIRLLAVRRAGARDRRHSHRPAVRPGGDQARPGDAVRRDVNRSGDIRNRRPGAAV